MQASSLRGGGRVTPVHTHFTAHGDPRRMPRIPSPRHAPASATLLAALALAAAPVQAADTPVDPAVRDDPRLVATQHARVALLADHAAVRPGQRLLAGLRIVHDPGWHSYWVNPGDSGLATRYTWTLPEGAAAGEIHWPFPERLPFGPLTNFGYGGAVLLPVELRVPATAKPGSRFTAQLRARWLICEETCIPDEATLRIELPVAAQARRSADAPAFAEALARVPEPLPQAKGHSWRDATHVATQIDATAIAEDAQRVEVFPLTPQVVVSGPIEVRPGPGGTLQFRHPASDAFDAMPSRVEWVIGVRRRDGAFKAYQLSVPGEDARAP